MPRGGPYLILYNPQTSFTYFLDPAGEQVRVLCFDPDVLSTLGPWTRATADRHIVRLRGTGYQAYIPIRDSIASTGDPVSEAALASAEGAR